MKFQTMVFFLAMSVIPCTAIAQPVSTDVCLVKSDPNSFTLNSGEYVVSYARNQKGEGWIKISRQDIAGPSIATKGANGEHLNVTDFGAGEGSIYGWQHIRKDSKMFRSLSCKDSNDAITITIETSRAWSDFKTILTAYKKYPGLIHWNVTASTKIETAFSGSSQPDCQFLMNNTATEWDQLVTHQVARYMVQRGPESGIVYFRDVPMNSFVFYFEDFSSLNDLYKLTGSENPYDYPVVGNGGAVRMGQAESDFQMASPDGTNVQKPKAWTEKLESFDRFGYYRPASVRIPEGKKIVLSDTYLYLRPALATDNVTICRNFIEMLSHVYQYIYKPPLIKTDWAGEIAPRMIKDILRPENLSVNQDGIIVPRAYVGYEHADQQLWTVIQLLHPLELYVKQFPKDANAKILRDGLNNALPRFYDKDYKGFNNGPAPLPIDLFFTIVYIVNPGIAVADTALLGNENAKMMLTGFRDKLIEMGKKCDYVFADVWLKDFSKQKSFYAMDGTGAYAYMLIAIYELSGGKDKECLEAAKAAVEKIKDRCLDYSWEVNQSAASIIACEKLYQITKDPHYRDILQITLANTLRHAWLWECDYGLGEKATTFWAMSGCPAAPCSAEYEAHRTRFHFRQYLELAGTSVSAELKSMLADSWKIGMTQSRTAIPPLMIKAGAQQYIAKDGMSQTNCGGIDQAQMIPLEDVRVGWGTDMEWWQNNAKLGVVGQEIYGAGGPIWYALWQQDELK
jgi:hypothetical protein